MNMFDRSQLYIGAALIAIIEIVSVVVRAASH